jgi:hypothetical protein
MATHVAGTTPTRRHRVGTPAAASEIARIATYATTLAGIYLSVGFLFYYASYEKLITDNGTMPASLQKLFAGSFFASVPGDSAAWTLLGLLEAAVVVLLAISLLTGEFLPQRRKPILLAGLGVSLLAFGVTIVVMFLVRQLSPYRPMTWLAGGAIGDADAPQ